MAIHDRATMAPSSHTPSPPPPTPPVHWRADGTPVSPRFRDIYRSAGDVAHGGLAQARHVFLGGCDLRSTGDRPTAWSGASRWAVLETGFGLGLNFLATWHAWRQDAQRPARLIYSAVEAFPPDASDLVRSAREFPELVPLATALARQWHGLLPGVHRLCFDDEHVTLTLAIGDAQHALAELGGAHDALYLDGFSPACNPDMWSAATLQAAARRMRPGARAATWCVATEVRERLARCGFEVERVPGLPPKRHALRARFAPGRQASSTPLPSGADRPGRCAVVGGGLAGASVAFSLARRGWRVTVLDGAGEPAGGASGLPAGVVAPHVSPDDRPLSVLTRAGVRATLARAANLLHEGIDFAATGVLERHQPGKRRRPASWQDAAASSAARPQSLDASDPLTRRQADAARALLDETNPALWHERAGWIRPPALVRAMLRAPGIDWRGGARVAHLDARHQEWILRDAAGEPLATADLVVVAAGFDSRGLLGDALPLHPLRGQIAFGPMPTGDDAAGLPRFPVNGHGSLIAHLPGPDGPGWVTGSTFERESSLAACVAPDHASNRERLHELLPAAATLLDAQWSDGRARSWAGVRATLPDRLPAVGAFPDSRQNQSPALAGNAQTAIDQVALNRRPIHLCTGLGARGLTLAVLCGEVLAATLHDEPLPVARSAARCLRASRFAR